MEHKVFKQLSDLFAHVFNMRARDNTIGCVRKLMGETISGKLKEPNTCIGTKCAIWFRIGAGFDKFSDNF